MFHVTFNPRTNPKHRATGSHSELRPVTVKVSEADVMASSLPAVSVLLLLFWEVCAAGEKCVCWGGGGGIFTAGMKVSRPRLVGDYYFWRELVPVCDCGERLCCFCSQGVGENVGTAHCACFSVPSLPLVSGQGTSHVLVHWILCTARPAARRVVSEGPACGVSRAGVWCLRAGRVVFEGRACGVSRAGRVVSEGRRVVSEGRACGV